MSRNERHTGVSRTSMPWLAAAGPVGRVLRRGLVVVAVATLTLAGCGNGPGDGGPGPTASGTSPAATSPAPTSPAPTSPSSTGPEPTGSVGEWSSSPLIVERSVPVPPVPRLLGIRSAPHSESGYDRITFDFASLLPGYEVRYVDQPVAAGSGEPVDIAGRRYLQITFHPAQAHDDSGTQSVTPRSATLDYPMLKAYAISGDFEGVLTIVLGLDDVVGFRVGELPGAPGRIYLDVAA